MYSHVPLKFLLSSLLSPSLVPGGGGGEADPPALQPGEWQGGVATETARLPAGVRWSDFEEKKVTFLLQYSSSKILRFKVAFQLAAGPQKMLKNTLKSPKTKFQTSNLRLRQGDFLTFKNKETLRFALYWGTIKFFSFWRLFFTVKGRCLQIYKTNNFF